jgi:hypothetical protein
LRIGEVFEGFPGCIMVRVTCPFDQIFRASSVNAMVEDFLHNVFWGIVDGDWRGWWSRERPVWKCRGVLVWSE